MPEFANSGTGLRLVMLVVNNMELKPQIDKNIQGDLMFHGIIFPLDGTGKY